MAATNYSHVMMVLALLLACTAPMALGVKCKPPSHKPAPPAALHVRLISASKFNATSAAAKNLTIKQLAQNDIDATISAIEYQTNLRPGSVVVGIAGTPLNENFVNGSAAPEWGSYVKIIDFIDADAYDVYASKKAPSFTWQNYTQNKNFQIGSKIKWVGTLTGAESSVPLPVAPVWHVSLSNATAGETVAPVTTVISERLILNQAVSSLTLYQSVKAWTKSLAPSDAEPQTIANVLAFTSSNAAVAYKAYKSGNAPGPVGTLPLYATIKSQITPTRDIEFTPIKFWG